MTDLGNTWLQYYKVIIIETKVKLHPKLLFEQFDILKELNEDVYEEASMWCKLLSLKSWKAEKYAEPRPEKHITFTK